MTLAVVAMLTLATTKSQATLVTATGTGSDSQTISASADFVFLGGNQLQVTLKNTYSGTTYGIAEVLYGVFFQGVNGMTLTSATTPTGTLAWDLSGLDHGSVGTSSAYGNQTPPNWALSSGFGGTGASALGGGSQSYGLVSAGFNGTVTDGLATDGHNPYLQNSLVLVFNYTSLSSSITNVEFQFGTTGNFGIRSTNGIPTTNITSVPEPSTIVAGALLLLPFGISTIRILRKGSSKA
jgi:hypothetical protein